MEIKQLAKQYLQLVALSKQLPSPRPAFTVPVPLREWELELRAKKAA
jgi:hypothetical protein